MKRFYRTINPTTVVAFVVLMCLPGCDTGSWERAQWRVHEQELGEALARYQRDYGALPLELSELVPEYVPELRPGRGDAPAYLYDRDTGRVDVVALMEPAELERIKATDEANVARLNEAIDAYRNDHASIPLSLDALVPEYLPALPEGATPTSDYYFAGTGEVVLPPELQALYDSVSTAEDTEVAPEDLRDTYDDLVDDLDAVDELSEGEGYPDPRNVLAEGTRVFESHRNQVGEETGTGPIEESEPPEFAVEALDRYEDRDVSSLPTPGEVLDAGTTVFHELYGTESDPDRHRRSEEKQ